MNNITYLQARRIFLDTCICTNNINEKDALFIRIIEYLTTQRPLYYIQNPHASIPKKRLLHCIQKLNQHIPVQYITHNEWFCNQSFYVNKHVLIPRPETQELIEWMNVQLPNQNLKILDIGTGSGCIAISLKLKNKLFQLYATDNSTQALKVAKRNAALLKAEIKFQHDSILNPQKKYPLFDVIVSNPPYILPSEKLASHILHHEPHQALFVTNNHPLQFYNAIIQFAEKYLSHHGFLFFETHSKYGKQVEKLLQLNHFSTQLKKDMYNKNRMLMAWRK